ncbi:MAG TPA: hypothetical protein VLT88_09240 [Desulfosarcina sp.]|nr:hypothetical protein [Desulfosarcina sp.]
MIVPAALVLVGVMILIRGWKLFWLFVGAAGFASGFHAADIYLGDHPFGMQVVLGLAFGIIGVLLALFFQKLSIAVAGFLAGSTIALYLGPALNHHFTGWLVILAGSAGAVVFLLLFDWALIVLSAVIGAGLVMDGLGWQGPHAPALYLIMALAGIAIQSRSMIRSRQPEA